MALADERGAEHSPQGNPNASYEQAFDRQPPQDWAAEQSVLGGMMLSKDAIADVVEVLRPTDFYRPAHQAIYDCVLDLYGRGEPADPITVSAELERRGELLRVGGAPYMHTLIATVPTAANASYYAEIVSEKAVLRRLVEAGTRIVQLGYHGAEGSAIEEVVDRAQAAVYDVTERRTTEDYASLEELLQPTMDELDAIASRGGDSQGVPTGFTDLDAVTNGLHPGQLVVVAARPGVGKALALDTLLPTPSGWTTMGAVSLGDQLLGADGQPTTVVEATEVLYDRTCYEVGFSDGTTVIADAQHQWLTCARGESEPRLVTGYSVKTTEQIDRTLSEFRDQSSHTVALSMPLCLDDVSLPLAPYSLGALLARGYGEQAMDRPGVTDLLDRDGLDDATREALFERIDRATIPPEYLRASAAQRAELLAGLLDVGATATRSFFLALREKQLAEDVQELVASLGQSCQVRMDSGRVQLVISRPHGGFWIDHDAPEVRSRHQSRLRDALSGAPAELRITSVRQIESVPVRCVQVGSVDHLYLAGRSMIPTHNSTLGLDFSRSASIKHGVGSVIFSLEMGRTEIVMRMLSAESQIRLADMRGGKMNDDDWTRLARRMSEISEAPLFIDDSPNLTMMEIRAKARRLKQRDDIQLIVVDYMQLMTSGKRVESRQQEVSEFSRNLKLLAKELEVPVVAISQLNRGPEQRTDKKPQLADLRESGCLTGKTGLLRADTGAKVTFDELMASGERPLVWSLDERTRLVPRPITNVFSSGIKEVFQVRLGSGREIEATANHPMLTVDGWLPLGALAVGERVAVPCHVPEPVAAEPMAEAEVIFLANVIGGGSSGKQPRRCASVNGAIPEAENEAVNDFDEKCIPERVFSLPREQVALFLRHLWHTSESNAASRAVEDAIFVTSSRRLADDVQQLLLRLSIRASIRAQTTGAADLWLVHCAGESRKALAALETYGARSAVRFDSAGKRASALDSVSPEASPAQARTAEVGLLDNDLGQASSDVRWDEIVEITSLGEQPVFDATVDETHNFVADGIVLHNSIEQDSDLVLLVHRPDAFERDDPRMGEADLILAKHRAGPTSTVTVAHQLHYSRFVDMAQG